MFAPEPEAPLRTPVISVYVAGRDWEVLVWAWKISTVKLESSVRSLMAYLGSSSPERAQAQSQDKRSGPRPTKRPQLLLNLFELENLLLMRRNEAEQRLAMKQPIVINSTGPGRHRRAPSEFSGAPTMKKKQLMSSISTTTLRGAAELPRTLILPTAAPSDARLVHDGSTARGFE